MSLSKGGSTRPLTTDHTPIGMAMITHTCPCLRPAQVLHCPLLHAGLRSLQGRKQLEALVKQVSETRARMRWSPSDPPPLLIKIAPDLTDSDKQVSTHICRSAYWCGACMRGWHVRA